MQRDFISRADQTAVALYFKILRGCESEMPWFEAQLCQEFT